MKCTVLTFLYCLMAEGLSLLFLLKLIYDAPSVQFKSHTL